MTTSAPVDVQALGGSVEAAEATVVPLAPTAESIPTRSLGANVGWSVAGNLVYALSQWGMLSATAKLGTVEMVGSLALALAVTSPVFVFASLQLRVLLVTDVERRFSVADYLALRVGTTLLALVIVSGVLGVTDYGSTTAWVVVLVAIGKGFDAVGDILFGLMQRAGRMDIVAKALFANGAVSLVLLATGIWATGNLTVGVAGWLLTSGAVLALWVVPQAHVLGALGLSTAGTGETATGAWGSAYGRARELAALVWQSAPVTLAMALATLNVAVPRLVLERSAGLREVGVYAGIASLMVVGSTLAAGIAQPLSPRLTNLIAAGQVDQFRRMLAIPIAAALLAGLVGVVCAVVAGEWILTFFFSSDYRRHVDVLALVMAGAGLLGAASLLGTGASAMRNFAGQVRVQAVALVVTVATSALLVGRYGIVGATTAILAQSAILFLGYGYLVRSGLRRHGAPGGGK